MNNMTEKIKDFLYDAMDYILILLIIVLVTGIIGWRLDILFAEDVDKIPIDITYNDDGKTEDDTESNEKDNDEPNTENEGDNISDTEDNQYDNDNETDSSDTTVSEQSSEKILVVEIPKGALPPTIADILEKEGLIDNKSNFLSKAVEMNLDTKLQSGEFRIKENTSLEAIIKIIARQK